MKKQFIHSLQTLALCGSALLLAQCSNDEFASISPAPVGNTTFKAVFEGQPSTRTSISDDGNWNVLWSENDAFGVFDNEKTLKEFQISQGVGTTNATFTGNITDGKTAEWAYYPYSAANLSMTSNVISVKIPSEGAYNTPMLAKVSENKTDEISFKHLAAMVKLPVNAVPTGATKLVITSADQAISGNFQVNTDSWSESNLPVLTYAESTPQEADKKRTFSLSYTAQSNQVYYFSLPVGTYSSLKMELTNSDATATYMSKTFTNLTLNRRDILVIATQTAVSASTLQQVSSALGTLIPSDPSETPVTTEVKISNNTTGSDNSFDTSADGNQSLSVPVVANQNVVLSFAAAPSTSETNALVVKDATNSEVTESQSQSTNKVELTIPDNTTASEAPDVTIEMPSSTVALGASEGKANYGKVTVMTAQSTFIVKEGVTIEELTVKGGNLIVYGTVKKLIYDAGTATVKVASYGAADIQSVEDTNSNFKFTSTWDGKSRATLAADATAIYTAAQLASLQAQEAPKNANSKSLTPTIKDKTLSLCADIDLDNKPWLGMVLSAGTFDGQSHTVSNLNMSQFMLNQQETIYTPEACIGFFAAVYGESTVKNITLDGVTIKPSAGTSPKWVGSLVGLSYGKVTNYTNCTAKNVEIFCSGSSALRVGGLIGYIERYQWVANVATAVLDNCHVENASIAASYSYGGLVGSLYDSAIFKDCSTSSITLSLNGTALSAYLYGYVSKFIGDIVNAGNNQRTVEITNCSADELTMDEEIALKVSMGGCKWCGIVDDASGTTFIIKVDGTTLVPGTDYNVVRNYLSTPEQLHAAIETGFAQGGDFHLINDIDLSGITCTLGATVSKMLTIDGHNHSIKGLKVPLISGTWVSKSVVIKNLTISDSAIQNDVEDEIGTVGVGAFVAQTEASDIVTLENCHLTKSSVKGGHWTGGLVGYAAGYSKQDDGPVFETLTMQGCTVTDSTIEGKGSCGGIIGHGTGSDWTKVNIASCTVTGNEITSTGTNDKKAGSLIGTVGCAGQEAYDKTGGIYVTDTTVSNNTVTSNGVSIDRIYGRQGNTTGKLYVNGVEQTLDF
ncbi:MAG: fimbrillin family protein [Bacteroides sp.]